jgi:hypothetical protein
VDYNGAAVEKTGDTVMIDTANNIMGGNLSALANGYNAAAVPPRRMVSRSPSSAAPPTAPPPLPITALCRKGSGAATSAYSSTPPGPADPSDAPAGGSPAFFTDGIVMKKHLLALGLLLAGVSPAQALDVGDISSL